jgi:hypothetical protein
MGDSEPEPELGPDPQPDPGDESGSGSAAAAAAAAAVAAAAAPSTKTELTIRLNQYTEGVDMRGEIERINLRGVLSPYLWKHGFRRFLSDEDVPRGAESGDGGRDPLSTPQLVSEEVLEKRRALAERTALVQRGQEYHGAFVRRLFHGSPDHFVDAQCRGAELVDLVQWMIANGRTFGDAGESKEGMTMATLAPAVMDWLNYSTPQPESVYGKDSYGEYEFMDEFETDPLLQTRYNFAVLPFPPARSDSAGSEGSDEETDSPPSTIPFGELTYNSCGSMDDDLEKGSISGSGAAKYLKANLAWTSDAYLATRFSDRLEARDELEKLVLLQGKDGDVEISFKVHITGQFYCCVATFNFKKYEPRPENGQQPDAGSVSGAGTRPRPQRQKKGKGGKIRGQAKDKAAKDVYIQLMFPYMPIPKTVNRQLQKRRPTAPMEVLFIRTIDATSSGRQKNATARHRNMERIFLFDPLWDRSRNALWTRCSGGYLLLRTLLNPGPRDRIVADEFIARTVERGVSDGTSKVKGAQYMYSRPDNVTAVVSGVLDVAENELAVFYPEPVRIAELDVTVFLALVGRTRNARAANKEKTLKNWQVSFPKFRDKRADEDQTKYESNLRVHTIARNFLHMDAEAKYTGAITDENIEAIRSAWINLDLHYRRPSPYETAAAIKAFWAAVLNAPAQEGEGKTRRLKPTAKQRARKRGKRSPPEKAKRKKRDR